jgi:glucuronate isomerase
MKPFLSPDFLLETETARRLYHDHAANLPIIDYHSHLSPAEIAGNHQFENLTEVWLTGDHYKWRAMRANGVDESFITGDKSDWEKFYSWAKTVPCTLRNPLFHWTHLELQRYFDIHTLLQENTARKIYEDCNEKLKLPEFRVQGLLKKMKVEILCTTDDPADDLEFHLDLQKGNFPVKVFPTFRPDRALALTDTPSFCAYLDRLGRVSGISISTFSQFVDALKSRHDFFHAAGCRASDHGLEQLYPELWTETDLKNIFDRALAKEKINPEQARKFQSGLLHLMAEWDHEKNWVQQFHLGALRNNNSRMLSALGPDTGWDSIGDFPQAHGLSFFLNALDEKNKLAKTIIYNNNPCDNEMMATMIGNFNDGSVRGKVQWGSAWWFLDQKDGITRQLNAISNMGLISRFVGMITDSRSFLSFPRHEYFRRILCGLLGDEIERGELPGDLTWTAKMVGDICYQNALNFFEWDEK